MSPALSTNSIISHYRIVSKLGAGGMGEVWLAEDTRLGRKVALKLLPGEFTEDSERVRRFTLEAKAASALNHPNIISVYDIGESETGRFIVMEFVAGHTLRWVIARDNSLETFFTLGAQMAKALSAAHAAGITHRDIKPDNIMVRDDGYVKMLDFGLARLLPTTASDPEAMTLAQQTTPGTVMGTLAYMSPEQASGQTVGSASDVFALGIVLYELATGSHPFKSETMIGYLHAITSQVPSSMTSLRSHLPPALDDLILRMLEKDASSRPTASDVAQALQEIEKYGSSNTLPFRVVTEKPKVSGAEEGFWVAVLPLKYRGSDADLEALAEGLSEDIITGLSRFSCLRVISRGSTLRFTSENADVRSIGKQLGARYVMEGSLRQAGSMLRLVVQLVDATTGAHLWAETYDRTVDAEKIFALQDELVPRIVSTVADWYGVLTHSMSEAVRLKPFDQLTPYEAVLRSFGYYERVTAEEHAAARSALERAVDQAPGNADGWAMLSMMYGEEFRFGFNEQPDPMGRSLRAARRAVDIAPSNHFAHLALAQALFFRKEFDAFRHAAERAIALNPMDGSTMEYVSHLIAFSGDWDYGCQVAERARQLNPNHPGWYWAVPFYNAYRNGDYRSARAFALKIDQPTVDLCQVMLAAVYGQLGEHEAAHRTVHTLLSLTPDTSVTRKQLDKWYQPELVEKLIDGLRKAGLNIDEQAPLLSRPASSEITSSDGFWVAVLPFKFNGSNAEVATLADGLTEEIVTGLSRFSYLRVISRSSILQYATEASDIGRIGKTLGARYVMEGSLRLAGSMLRVSAQLVDASTGAHLWAETYDRPFRLEDIFGLQDDLASRIVSTVADQYGALVHSMSESLRGRNAGQYSPHESMLRAFGYWERMTPEEHAEVRDILEAAVAVAPDHSDCLAELAMIYWHEYAFGYNLRPDPIGRARAAAQRAVASAPTSHFAHCALATSLFFQKDYLAFRPAAERALALNRMDSSTAAILGNMIAYAGDWEYGLGIVERATQLNPHHAGWYHYVAFCDAYRKHDYQGALASALKVNMPAYHWPHVYLAAVYGQLGEQQRASTALREVHALVPNFGAIAREEFGKWLDPELTEHLLDGLRKAGLEIADEDHPVASNAFNVSGEKKADEGFWVAVLPFKATGTNTELSTLAEGLSDEIVTGLNRFSYLRVIASSSTLQYASQTSDVRTVGKELGARYVIEGGLRQAGTKMRLAVRLVDTTTGAHIWAENYERTFNPETVFELQDELVPRIVSTVADSHGVLPRSMSEAVQNRAPEELSPYEAVLRSFNYPQKLTSAALKDAVFSLELAVQKAPAYADAWAMLGAALGQDYAQGYNVRVDSLARAKEASRKAVELAPSNHWAWASLARVHFFEKELQSFRDAVEKAVALNPMDGDAHASLGEMLTFSGAGDRGLELVERAKQLNPNHPGWYWYANFYHAYKQRDYRAALNFALKVNLPGHWAQPLFTAAASGQLGETESAANAVSELLKLRPDVRDTVRKDFMKWWSSADVEHLLDGLRKAGLETGERDEARDVAPSPTHPVSLSQSHSSGSLTKSIAVLPFQNLSADTEQEFFADGITEEILNSLAQIKELRVAGRSSSFSFKGRNEDLRSVGAKLNVTSILEGTLRRSGDRLRITAQLIDAVSGYQLWSERYDRVLEDIFDVQDEIALAVVDALKLTLFGEAKEAVVKRYTDDAEVHALFLKGRYYSYKYTAEGWTRAVEFFERVIEKQPDHAPAYAAKAAALGCLWFFGLSPADKAVPQFRSAATKALELDENLAGAHLSLGMVNFFHDWEWEKAEQEFKQAILLNPKDAEALSYYAMFLAFVDRFDEAMALARRALEVDPLSLLINMNVAWTYFSAGLSNEAFDQARKMTEIEPGFFGAYWLKGAIRLGSGDYEEALEQLTKAVSLGGYPAVLADLGAANALAGKKEAAETILNQLLDMRRQSYVPAICLARVYSRLGELEKTIQWLETAFEERNGELLFLESEIDSAAAGDSLNSLGKDPRVIDLLERVKLPSRKGE